MLLLCLVQIKNLGLKKSWVVFLCRHYKFLFLIQMPQTSMQLLEVVMARACNILNVIRWKEKIPSLR